MQEILLYSLYFLLLTITFCLVNRSKSLVALSYIILRLVYTFEFYPFATILNVLFCFFIRKSMNFYGNLLFNPLFAAICLGFFGNFLGTFGSGILCQLSGWLAL